MSVITSQPLPNNEDNIQAQSPEHFIQEEEEKKRERQREDCCADALDCEGSDIFFLCHCIAWCCRGIGDCTESCFDNCGDCISSCCESSDNTIDGDVGGCNDCNDCIGCCSD